jgi:hypothetical protein
LIEMRIHVHLWRLLLAKKREPGGQQCFFASLEAKLQLLIGIQPIPNDILNGPTILALCLRYLNNSSQYLVMMACVVSWGGPVLRGRMQFVTANTNVKALSGVIMFELFRVAMISVCAVVVISLRRGSARATGNGSALRSASELKPLWEHKQSITPIHDSPRSLRRRSASGVICCDAQERLLSPLNDHPIRNMYLCQCADVEWIRFC